MPYLNIAEVESALSVAAAAPYAGFTQLITLPNLTWEGRQCHAIKIGNGSRPGRPGIYFLGGIHSREWGSSDILINFIEVLEQAYQQGTVITIGSMTFSLADIQDIVNNLDIFVFPQANPDGRNYSMNTEALWRKNRRPQAPNTSTGACVEVDVNRNYDFLWNFPQYFSPSAPIEDATDPCDYQLYNGPSAFSEPESQNAKWIFDQLPDIGYFVDLHSYGSLILYSWGDSVDQSTDPTMNFLNSAFDGQRGLAAGPYNEYIPAADLATAQSLAGALQAGILALRGTNYTVEQSFELYPTAGTSDDYAYSRHFVDPSNGNIISYTLEWGTEFQPPYSEMQNIIQENTCGLLNFCRWVRDSLRSCQILLNRNPIGQDEISARRKQPRGTPGGLPIADALRVLVDGYSAPELGLTGPNSTLAAPPAFTPAVTGLSILPSSTTPNFSDNGDYGSELQRFTFVYDLDFPDPSDPEFSFSTPTSPTPLGVTVSGAPSASAILTLIKQPDPFLLHGDPPWLSIDLRVFTVKAGETSAFGPAMGADAFAAPTFIQNVISALNTSGSSAEAAFAALPTDESSKLYIYPKTDGALVFDFAVAKVQYIGLIGAANVRVFFRLFQAQSTNGVFDYPPGAQYRRNPSNPDGQSIPLAGILGGEYVTIPCFAHQRIDSTTTDMDQQTDMPNVLQFIAKADGSEVDVYYGCWLDINQPFKPDGSANNVLPLTVPSMNVDGPFQDAANPPQPIQSAILRALHQCLVAEIAFDGSSIPLGVDTINWDKLAQRNLAWADVGSAVAVTPFEIRPTIDADGKPKGSPQILITHLMEGIGIALDVPGNRMFVTDFAGSVYSANLDGSQERNFLYAQGNLTGIAYAEIDSKEK
jgi:murein tripeptide amidase MpaA